MVHLPVLPLVKITDQRDAVGVRCIDPEGIPLPCAVCTKVLVRVEDLPGVKAVDIHIILNLLLKKLLAKPAKSWYN